MNFLAKILMLVTRNRFGLSLLALLALMPVLADSQTLQQSAPDVRSKKQKITYPFDNSDRLQGYIAPMQTHYFVGEPIVVPLVLVNHTRYPITVETNFNPRSLLTIAIRPEGESERRFYGPYMKGTYGPSPIFMFPLDEFHYNAVIWSDIDSASHLAISKPGNYTFRISLKVALDESPHGGDLDLGMFTIQVDPTPAELEPVIELLKQDDNLFYLDLHKNPPKWGEQVPLEILKRYPATVFTPYLQYALASYYVLQYNQKPSKETSNNALMHYQLACLSDSPFRQEIYVDLLSFLDKLDLSIPAAQIAKQMLKSVKPWDRGRVGDLQLAGSIPLQKYLPTVKELPPDKYWAFLP